MAGLRLIGFGKQPPQGARNRLTMVMNSPHHHYVLTQPQRGMDEIRSALAALGADAQGLQVNIREVGRPAAIADECECPR